MWGALRAKGDGLVRWPAALLVLSATLGASFGAAAADEFAAARTRLVDEITRDAAATKPWTGRSGFSAATMAALATVPRHLFVPETVRANAYENRPLAIGHGQTISQPYIVALMTDLLEVGRGDKVLEVGTGSGYQAAVLAALGVEVFTIEIIEPLYRSAARRFAELGYRGVTARHGDGYYGWAEEAPFDGIMVTAAASHIPPPLVKQLKPGARLVLPVGSHFLVQQLVVVEKDAEGKVTARQLLPVRFVPLTGGH